MTTDADASGERHALFRDAPYLVILTLSSAAPHLLTQTQQEQLHRCFATIEICHETIAS